MTEENMQFNQRLRVVDHDGKKSGGCKMKREDSITEKN
jgi:hypothetical protein